MAGKLPPGQQGGSKVNSPKEPRQSFNAAYSSPDATESRRQYTEAEDAQRKSQGRAAQRRALRRRRRQS